MSFGTTTLMASALLAIGLMGAISGKASAEEHRSKAQHCVSLNAIQRTEVVSDSAILFYMHGDDVYVNRLPHPCPGLNREETFMYRTSLGQLCDLDIISVLDDIGFGLTPGASCGLGMFHPISEREVEVFKAGEVAGH